MLVAGMDEFLCLCMRAIDHAISLHVLKTHALLFKIIIIIIVVVCLFVDLMVEKNADTRTLYAYIGQSKTPHNLIIVTYLL